MQSVVHEGSLMGAQQPTLQERDHAMGLGQQIVAGRRRVPRDSMHEPAAWKPGVTGQPIRHDIASRLNQILRHIQQGDRFGVRNHLKPRPPYERVPRTSTATNTSVFPYTPRPRRPALTPPM